MASINRVVVAGSRDFENGAVVRQAIADSGFHITTLISGGCPTGVDLLGEEWARGEGRRRRMTIEIHPACWEGEGQYAAGPKRNGRMADVCDGVIVVCWAEGSKGSESMIKEAERAKKPIHIVRVPGRAPVRTKRGHELTVSDGAAAAPAPTPTTEDLVVVTTPEAEAAAEKDDDETEVVLEIEIDKKKRRVVDARFLVPKDADFFSAGCGIPKGARFF